MNRFRTLSLLYIIDYLLEKVVGNRTPVSCGGFNVIPLSCSRYLWNYNSRESFAYRLDSVKAKGLSKIHVTLGHLGRIGTVTDEKLVDVMAKWCEGIDELGSLIWMIAAPK